LSTCTTNGNCSSFACGWDFSGACDDCTKASSCCASLLACSDTPACRALVECSSGCNGAQGCLSACGQVAGQTAIDQYNAAFGCADSQCGAQCGGMVDAGMLTDEGSLPEAAPPEDASAPELCDPPCLSSETCSKLSPLANPSCNGNQCVHVTCPTSLSCGGDSFDPGCTAYGGTVEYGAVCGASATGRDPNVETCMVGPANTMHCDFPEGSVDCPALWENLTGQVPEYTYTAGCCGAVPTVPATPLPYCGIPGDDGNAPICAPVTAGVGGWMPAP
jgi:hypothetical protein